MIHIPDLYNFINTNYESTNKLFKLLLVLLIPIKYMLIYLLVLVLLMWIATAFGVGLIIISYYSETRDILFDSLSIFYFIFDVIIIIAGSLGIVLKMITK